MPIRAAHLSALLLTLAAAAHAQTDTQTNTQTDTQTQPQTTPAEPAEPTAPPGQFGASGSGWLPAEGLPRWRIRFEPSAAYLAPSGDLELPSGGSIRGNSFDLEDINLDTPQLEPMGELHFSRGRTRIMIEGAGFSATQSFNLGTSAVLGAAPIGPNDPARISFEYQTFAVTGSRRLATWASGVRPDGSSEVAFGIDILAGLRFHRLDIDAEVLPVGPIPPTRPTQAQTDEIFAEPIIGTRFELDLDERFTLEWRLAAGAFGFGDHRSISGDLAVSFTYRPDPRVGIQAGYRLLVLSLQSGDSTDRFEWTGALAGLYWGASFSF